MNPDKSESDLESDDFAYNQDVLRHRARQRAHEKFGNDVLDIIRNRFRMTDITRYNLDDYLSYRDLDAKQLKGLTTTINGYDFHVVLIEYYSSYPVGRSHVGGNDRYLMGHFTTRTKYPRTYIHKETISEKFSDLFLKRDVDFAENKWFSSKFQVLTEDKNRLTDLLRMKDLDRLAQFRDMEIELSSQGCLFRLSRKSISLKDAEGFNELASLLFKLFI